MIRAAMNGELDNVDYSEHPIFGVNMPTTCPNVPDELLDPKNTWENKSAYDDNANKLSDLFNENFEKFSNKANEDILAAAPKSSATV